MKQFVLIFGMAALAGLVPLAAMADPPEGAFRGLIQATDAEFALTVRFHAEVADIHFEEPASCSVSAKLLKQDDSVSVYRYGVSRNGGAFCDGLTGRDLTVMPAPNGALSIGFDSKRATWHGQLQPPSTVSR
jgi:hypothetical protein